MFFVPTFRPPPGATPATVTFGASQVDGVNATTFTFTSHTLNSPAGAKIVLGVAGMGVGAGITISSVKIHNPDVGTDPTGTSLTTIHTAVADGELLLQPWQCTLSSAATTVTLVVVWSSSKGSCGVGSHVVVGAAAAVYETPVTSTANPATGNVNCPANGVIISFASHGHSTVRTYGWTNLTEKYDETVEAGNIGHSGAADAFATAQSSLAVTATPSSTTTNNAFVAFSYAAG